MDILQTFVAFSEYMNFIKEAKTSQKYEFVHFRMTVNSGFVDSRFGIWSDEHVTIQWFNKDLVDWLVKYN